ncbi:hypothetical protein F5887DRAFT_937302 [Amanita rubescens]|nr:hypothetical protein F5887DRAFT_937302 [Amanita rubescens]
MDDLDPSTVAFRRAAPFAVLSRARLLSPSCSFPDSCPKCGTYLFDGSSEIRVIRQTKDGNKDNKSQSVLRRLCLVCRKTSVVKLSRENREHVEPPPTNSVPAPSPAQPSSHPINVRPTPPPGPQRHRQGGKQRAGLQELLSRNKKKNEANRSTDSNTASGLAAFLKDL